MSTYLVINLSIVLVPLIMSFEKNMKFYKNFIPLASSIILVGGVFIVWDAYATYRGDWSFNPNHIQGFRLINLPIEEIMFFITVPYAAIFLFETGTYYIKDSSIIINKQALIVLATLLVIASIIFYTQYYTFTVLLFCAFFLLLSLNSKFSILNSKIYWYWIFAMYIPFFVVNYILTSLPIVSYSPNAIWNIRVTTIPLEDFFYSFALLSLNLMVYKYVKVQWLIKRK